MQAEGLVEGLGIHALHVRERQLQAHVERQHPSQEQQAHARADVAGGDPLVIDGREKPEQPGRVVPGAMQSLEAVGRVGRGVFSDGHCSPAR